jgi:site-specific DNA-adenine methylase
VTSLDIDGNIYLLKNNGEISEYAKGKKQEFSISEIEPAFNQAAKLTVSNKLDYLYIFEPAGKRLVVFNKKGEFINQYTSDKFDNLKDYQVDEINKKIYFLNGTTVYSIEAIHLNK